MNLVRYYPKIIKFGIEHTSPGFDIKIKRIRYYNGTSTDVELGRLLFYPQRPGLISNSCTPQYFVDDEINIGIRYYSVSTEPFSKNINGNGCCPGYYIPLCQLFRYIQNKRDDVM